MASLYRCKNSSRKLSPTSAVMCARASVNSNLPEHLFVFAEYKSYDSNFYRLFDWIAATLAEKCESASAENTVIWLHPESRQFLMTISQKLNFRVGVFDQDEFAGLTKTNWYLKPKESAHPFNPMETASNLYFIVHKNQFDAPFDERGLYSARQELKTWGYNDKGNPSAVGAVLDCLRMITFHFRTYAEPLTFDEIVQSRIPEAYKRPENRPLTKAEQISMQMQQALIAEQLAFELGLVETEEEDDFEDYEGDNDVYW